MVALVLLLNVFELKVKVGVILQLAGNSQLLLDCPELVVVSSVVKQF